MPEDKKPWEQDFSKETKPWEQDFEVKKKDLSGQDSENPSEPSGENGKSDVDVFFDKKVDEVALAKGKENVAKLTNFNFDLPIEKQDATKKPEVIVEELNETRNKQVDFIKKQIDDNIGNIETQDQSIFKEQLRTSILEKTGNATIADEADSYIDEKLDDKLILDTEVQEQIISPENQQVFDNIAAAKNEELLGADAEAVVERAKEEQGEMFTPNDKVYKDYANYLSRKDEDKWKNYNEGVYSKGDEKGFNFYSEALTHQSNLNKIKLKGGAIDEKTFLLQQKDLQNKFQNNLVKFPEYQKEVNAQVERQTELDTSYDQAKKDIVSGDAAEKLKAAHILGYYNVVAPAVATFTKMGSGIISTAGRLTAMSIPGESERYVNNFIDDIDSYFNTEKASSIYKAPSQLKGSLFEKGEMNAELLLPKVSETAANMFGLLYGGTAISEELVGAGVASKIAPKIGLFTASFMSTQNQYYVDAKENGMSHDEAMSYSLTASTVTSLLEGVSPQKYLTGGGVKKISKSMLKDMTGTSTLNTIKKNAAFSMKEMGLEMLQEESQELGDNATNYVFNNLTGADLKTSTSLDEHAELLTLTAILSGGASVSGYSSSNSVRSEAFYTAMKNNEDFSDVLSKDNLVKDLGEDAVKQAQSDLKTYTEEFNKLPDSLNEGQKMFLASQTMDKKKRQSNVNKLNSVDEKIDVSREVAEEEKQIEIINSQMEEVLGDKAVKVEEEQESKTEKITPKDGVEKSKSDSYIKKLEETKSSDPESYWSVSSVSKEDAEAGTVVETEDGSALVGKDGDIKGVFKNTDSKAKGVAEKLIKKAVEAGGVKLDNFDNYLSKIYKKAGFRVVSRTPFNEEYAPEGWNKEKHGTPDVVAMVYDPEGKLDIEEKTFTDPESGYDDAMDYRNSYVEKTETKDSDTKISQPNAAINLMEEYKGKKIPEKQLKDAVAKNDIDILKNTEWYNELSKEQQETFEYDFKKSMGEDVSKLEKPKSTKETNPFVKKKARTILKEKIKTIKTSIKKGVSMGKKEVSALQKDVKDYANAVLEEFNLSPFQQKQVTNSILRAKNDKALVKEYDKIDKIVELAKAKDRSQAIIKIHKLISNKKSILKKKGKRWVGKVSPEVQSYIKNFDVSNLENMSREEVRDVLASLEGILKGAVAENQAFERAKKAQRRKTKAKSFLAFHKKAPTQVSGKESIIEQLEDPYNSIVIEGQLINSKTIFNEFLRDNPEANLENVSVYEKKSQQMVELNKERAWVEWAKKYLDPTRFKANLRNHLSHFAKAGKKARELGENIYNAISDADIEINENVSKKTDDYFSKIDGIFGSKSKAVRILEKESSIMPHKDLNVYPSNSMVINWYNMNKTKDGKAKIKADGKFDVDAVNEYMEAPENKKLKEYADYLLNDLYPSLKEEYEATFEYLTNTKFPEGLYYPLYSTVINEDGMKVENILDGDNQMNATSPMANNMIQRVKHTNPLDYKRDAHSTAIDYIKSMERAKQMTEVGEMVNDVFNKSSMPDIAELMGKQDLMDLMDHLTISITGNNPRKGSNWDSKMINTVQSIRVLGALSFKIASIPKQLTSAGRFSTAHDTSVMDWLKGFAPTTKDEIDFANKIRKSRYVKDRFKGESIDPEFNRLLKPKRGAKLAKLGSKLTKAGMVTTSLGDVGGVLLGGVPYALSVYRKGIKDGLSKDEAYDKAYKRFVKVSEETQQSTAFHEISHMQRDKVMRLFAAFTTSQTQGVNKIIHSARMLLSKDLSTEEKKHHRYNILYYSGENMFFSIVASGFIKSMLLAAGGDEEEKGELSKGVYDTVMDNMQSVISGLDGKGILVNQLINAGRADDWKNNIPVMQQLEKFTSGAKSLGTFLNGKEWDEMTDKEQKDLVLILPADGVYKQWKDMEKALAGEKTYVDALMGWKTKEEKKEYKKDDVIYEFIFGEPYSPKSTKSKRGGRTGSRGGR